MDLFNFIVWLTSGAVIGWFANQMIRTEHKRRAGKTTHSEDGGSDKS